jgi:hypothetical protein
MDLDSSLVSLCVLVDDWWRERHPSPARKKPGHPALPSDSTPACLLSEPVHPES